MIWTIKPYESVGPLRLGESRESVRRELGTDYDSFAKVASARLTDAYDNLGVHLYYDHRDLLEFVEMFEPAKAEYDGISLIGQSFASLDSELSKRAKASPSDVGYVYGELGIALTLADEQVEGVAVNRKGYYD